MAIKFYNTMTRKKEAFKSLVPKEVTMYNCGPTVYDYAHIGNLRAYALADLIRRYLEYRGYKVKQVMNLTDVGHMVGDADASALQEDKMAKAAKREKKAINEIADMYIKYFLEDSKKMNFKEPDVRPKATEHINEMIELIQKLIDNGYAYVKNGSVYFEISKFKDYGKLSGNTIENLEAGAGGRVEKNSDKKSQLDFALWVNDPDHIMKWKSPWSVGYPGWHIECSAMSMKYLGPTIDIHTGGEDNIFPHHDSEIAQSEGANGKKFVNYWLHTRHLLVNGEKMSKSKGNFYTLEDLEKKGYSAKALRFLLMSAHYRTAMNFTEENLKGAEKTVASMVDFMDRLEDLTDADRYNEKIDEISQETEKKFKAALDDDLNMPEALAAMFEMITFVNSEIAEEHYSKENLVKTRKLMIKFDKVLGVLEHKRIKIPEEIVALADDREAARKNKDFKKADEIRAEIEEKGYILEDSPSGLRIKKA